jgi:hypothetical protein
MNPSAINGIHSGQPQAAHCLSIILSFTRRFYPHDWRRIEQRYIQLKPTASETLKMLRELGALANWIYNVSGLEGVRFEPPVVSNITSLYEYERVQTELNQRIEEESTIVDVPVPGAIEFISASETVVMPWEELDHLYREYEMIGEYDHEAPIRPPVTIVGFDVTLTERSSYEVSLDSMF